MLVNMLFQEKKFYGEKMLYEEKVLYGKTVSNIVSMFYVCEEKDKFYQKLCG